MWALVKKSKKDLSTIKARDISPRKIVTITPFTKMKDALQKMKKLKYERLPVVHEKELVGMITAKDILSFHPEFYPELEEFSRIREEAKKLKRIKARRNDLREICEECGTPDILQRFNGMLICDSCRNSM